MPTQKEYAQVPRGERLARLERTPDELAEAVRGRSDEALSCRPDVKSWSAKEVICHLRDLEESFLIRIQQIMVMHEPIFITTDPDRWADDRQYLRNDATAARAAFRTRRGDTLEFLQKLATADWTRVGVHTDARGRRTIDDFLSVIAAHDDNHLGQLGRALEGRA